MKPYYAKPGWVDRYRVREVWAGFLELATFVLILVAIFGSLLLVAASMDALPR